MSVVSYRVNLIRPARSVPTAAFFDIGAMAGTTTVRSSVQSLSTASASARRWAEFQAVSSWAISSLRLVVGELVGACSARALTKTSRVMDNKQAWDCFMRATVEWSASRVNPGYRGNASKSCWAARLRAVFWDS